MDLAYICAEYLVDAISISHDYKMNFNYVQILRNLIGKDINPKVAEYLNKKSAHDFLLILKKFPDVFVIEEQSISLTEAFLTLYNLNKFLVSKKFYIINCYVENCAIEYFRKILKNQGPKPPTELFNMLMTDHTQKYAKYFLNFSMKEMFFFFADNYNYFTVNFIVNDFVVFLAPRPDYAHSIINDQDHTEDMKMFEISVYFLLTCFVSVHYFILKQCLSYVHESSKHILEQISLVRQRELFAVLPFARMDVSGFVTLKNKDISVALPNNVKTVLLLVCILAYKKEMYIVDLVVEFSNRMLPAVNYFSNLTFDAQIDFFRKYPMYFHVSYTGHISLLPEFLLPECLFPQSELESDLQTVQRNNVEQIWNVDSSPKDFLCLPGLAKIAIERIKQSFFYLSHHFYPLDNKHAMQTLLHAIDDVRISFCSFPDKHKFITECCIFINSLSEESLKGSGSSINDVLTEKDKNLLFIIYILSNNESIYFLTLIGAMEKHKIENSLLKSTVSDQFKYFRTLKGYIEVYTDGQIIFPSTFFPIKSIIESYSNLFSEFECGCPEVVSQYECDKLSKTMSCVADAVPLEQKSSQFEMQEINSEKISKSDFVLDVLFFFLYVCEKMSIEELFYQLNEFDIKKIQNRFSSFTIAEEVNIFKTLSTYIKFSEDGFMSLKKDAPCIYKPKTNINLFELFKKNSSSERSFSIPRIRSEFVKSTFTSEISVPTAYVNNVTKTRSQHQRSGSKEYENTHNKISYQVHKASDTAQLPKTVKNVFYNSSLGLQTSCSAKNALKTVQSSPVLKDDCNTMKDINKDYGKSESSSETEIIMEVTGTKNTSLLTDADSHMRTDQEPKFCDKNDKKEKIVKFQFKSATSSFEKENSPSLSEDNNKLKAPRHPIKESFSSKLSKYNLTLPENTLKENKPAEMGGSSVNKFSGILLGNDSKHSKTFELKSNFSNPSAWATVSLPDSEKILSFKEIDEALHKCSMPLGHNFHNDLKNDSSYQAYIFDLIDEFLYSDTKIKEQ